MTKTTDDILAHHGIKGMKWGVRRKRGKNGLVDKSSTPGKTTYSKPASRLTDAELNKRIKRMEAEKRYTELNAPKTIAKGESRVKKILKGAGEDAARKIATEVAFYTGKKAIEKAIGPKRAGDIFPKKK